MRVGVPPQDRGEPLLDEPRSRCHQRRNLQMTSVLGLVLISMSACLMPKSVPQGLGATPEGHPVEVEHQQRWQRKVDKLPFREAHLHTRRTLHGTVGGGLEGGPVVDSLRVGRSRVSRVLAHRGGASADLGGANKTVGRSNARGRPGTFPFLSHIFPMTVMTTPLWSKGRWSTSNCPVRRKKSHFQDMEKRFSRWFLNQRPGFNSRYPSFSWLFA
ncbi:hypothetical protein AAMO2058_000963200 [Amorphochlora amoebiformis]